MMKTGLGVCSVTGEGARSSAPADAPDCCWMWRYMSTLVLGRRPVRVSTGHAIIANGYTGRAADMQTYLHITRRPVLLRPHKSLGIHGFGQLFCLRATTGLSDRDLTPIGIGSALMLPWRKPSSWASIARPARTQGQAKGQMSRVREGLGSGREFGREESFDWAALHRLRIWAARTATAGPE